MEVLIINGSPKGDKSVTNGYLKYVEKSFKRNFTYINVGKKIKRLLRDEGYYNSVLNQIKKADLIVWSTPVYYFFVTYQLIEFINLVRERGDEGLFRGKLSTFLTTSINFFDNTAKKHLERVIDQFNMELYPGLQFNMYDIKKEDVRDFLLKYYSELLNYDSVPAKAVNTTVKLNSEFTYIPGDRDKIETEKRILLLHDNKRNLAKGFLENFKNSVESVNINSINVKSGCIGCCTCGWDNSCSLSRSDDHNSFYQNTLEKADIIVLSPSLEGEFFSPVWKKFIDRSFFVNHAPRLVNKQFLWLINGRLTEREYLVEFIDAYAQMNHGNLVGYISSSSGDANFVSRRIDTLAEMAVNFSVKNIIKPNNFLGVAGGKIFRDEIYSGLKFPFNNDHKVYKRIGYYDMPGRKLISIFISNIMLLLCRIKPFRSMVFKPKFMIDEMYSPLDKIIS